MSFYGVILNNLEVYERLVIFMGTLLWGDEVVYLLSFLSGLGVVSIFNVLIFGFFGNAGCDVFWFSVARSDIFPNFVKKIYTRQEKKSSKDMIEKESRHPFLLLLLSKFFMGTRLITLFYLARKKSLTFRKFLFYNSLAVIVWISFVATLLFFAGRSASIAFSDVENIIQMVNILFFSLVVLFLIYRFVVPRIVARLFGKK